MNNNTNKTDISDCIEVSVGSHPKRRRKIRFPSAGGAENDNVIGFKNVGAGSKSGNERLIQFSVGEIFYVLNSGAGERIFGAPY